MEITLLSVLILLQRTRSLFADNPDCTENPPKREQLGSAHKRFPFPLMLPTALGENGEDKCSDNYKNSEKQKDNAGKEFRKRERRVTCKHASTNKHKDNVEGRVFSISRVIIANHRVIG